MTLTYINQHLNTHEKCVKYLEAKRWKNVPKCPYCKSKKSSPKKLRYSCLECKNSFSITVGTVFHNSNLPLQKWLMAITIMLAAKKGVSSLQLSRDINVNKNTAWLLQMKIRAAMRDGQLDAIIHSEADNTEKCEKSQLPWNTFLQVRRQKRTTNFISTRHLKGYSIPGIKRLVKRAIFGQYHKVDEFYLDHYINEVQFKSDRKTHCDYGYEELLKIALFGHFAK